MPDTTIKKAFAARDAEHASARKECQERMRTASQELADRIRVQLESTPVNVLANEAGVTRQTLHDITKRYPATS